MGIGSSSYGIAARALGSRRLLDPLVFLEFCHEREAGGVQLPIPPGDESYLAQLRRRLAEWNMFLEASIRLPGDESEMARFTADVTAGKRAGAKVFRAVLLGGRRYEVFSSGDEFREFRRRSLRSLRLAQPVVEQHEVYLAVENHKDYRADELAELMRTIASPHVGVCVDTGNNVALLDDPHQAVKTLAPWAMSCHLKDMAVQEYDEGFLLAEVPLGEGFLDLTRITTQLKATRPGIHFNLEMITRDPLRVPCLTEKYWATFGNLPGRHLATMLATVREKEPASPLTLVSGLAETAQLELEDANVRKSLEYAARHLEL